MGLDIVSFNGLGLGWAQRPWARAGLGRRLAGPWRTLPAGERCLLSTNIKMLNMKLNNELTYLVATFNAAIN